MPQTRAVTLVTIVSGNGPFYRASEFARYIASRPELRHVRTRRRAPGPPALSSSARSSTRTSTAAIPDRPALHGHVSRFLDGDNRARPHEALAFALPSDSYTRPRPLRP